MNDQEILVAAVIAIVSRDDPHAFEEARGEMIRHLIDGNASHHEIVEWETFIETASAPPQYDLWRRETA